MFKRLNVKFRRGGTNHKFIEAILNVKSGRRTVKPLNLKSLPNNVEFREIFYFFNIELSLFSLVAGKLKSITLFEELPAF